MRKGCIIFPYGMQGRLAEYVLKNEFGIIADCIIDNGLPEEDGIFPIEKLKNEQNKTVLLCSDREDIYHEIRRDVCQYVSFDNIIDAMSPSPFWDPEIYYEPCEFKCGDGQFPRYSALELAAREVYKNNVPGAVAEVGVYKGGFASCMNRFLPDRDVYLFDTFKGFDERDIDERENNWSGLFREKTDFKDASEKSVLGIVDYNRAIVIKGYFPDTTVEIKDIDYAFVSLDTDLYKSIRAGLEYFWPRLSSGGYIFVDDYGHKGLQGVNKAVSEFVLKNHVSYVRVNDGIDSTAIIQKPL